jgi:hypothetical protein
MEADIRPVTPLEDDYTYVPPQYNPKDVAFPSSRPIHATHVHTSYAEDDATPYVYVQISKQKKGWVWAICSQDGGICTSGPHATLYQAYAAARFTLSQISKELNVVIEPETED